LSSTGLIFNIQRFSIHDGPGIRTTVFFKGCSLRCFWCHNPEGRHARPEIQYFPERCIGCGECLDRCPNQAHTLKEEFHLYLRELCKNCGICTETCYANALELIGKYMTVDEVMEEILRDRMFYETSSGGVTLSGGEPVLQPQFAKVILMQCKEQGLHTAIETCGNYQWQQLESVLPFTDLIMMDLKTIDPIKHKSACGDSNEQILANAKRLALTDKPTIFRTPIVPTINDTFEDVGAIVKFVRNLVELRLKHNNGQGRWAEIQFELLPFHRLAADKYRSLGLEYRARNLEPPTKERMQELAKIAEIEGVEVLVK
jgi:pyruvate formate lyase activating enzyme